MPPPKDELRAVADATFGALNAGDLNAFLALVTEDVEFTSMIAEAEATTFRGHDGVRAWHETVLGVFSDAHWDVLDVFEAPGSDALGIVHFHMAGTLGGVTVENKVWLTVELKEGKVKWWRLFRTEHEALEAAGLSE